jgi:alkanesulfonate monooxygenase SsuD/methylene tetrahydromethanopterin reductase-like flavin-dependent oxidoreductase (luciferase family)
MKHGIFLPPFDEMADPHRVAAIAADAEQAGWDGLFVWDHMLAEPGMAVADPWITMAAIATSTTRLRTGPMVTPLARRRPQVLARQIATLDQLSGGRLTVGVGLGDDGWREFSAFGDETSPPERGAMLDESLQVIASFLTGNEVDFAGHHYTVAAAQLLPKPVQDPVPFWAAVRWPNRKPLARAARLQGCFPIFKGSGQLPAPPAVADVTAVQSALADLSAPRSHDLVVRVAMHRLAADTRAEAAADLADAGVTWLLEAFEPGQDAGQIEAYVRSGPPSGKLGE